VPRFVHVVYVANLFVVNGCLLLMLLVLLELLMLLVLFVVNVACVARVGCC